MYSFLKKSLYIVFIIKIVAFATDILKQKSYTNINIVQNKVIMNVYQTLKWQTKILKRII